MSEWEEKLNTLLSDPDAMAQVMGMAQSLSQQLGAQNGGAAAQTAQETAGAELSSLLGGIDPAAVQKLLPVLRQLDRPESGETAALLRALRPFLSPKRQDKVERAAQLARLIYIGKSFLLSGEG